VRPPRRAAKTDAIKKPIPIVSGQVSLQGSGGEQTASPNGFIEYRLSTEHRGMTVFSDGTAVVRDGRFAIPFEDLVQRPSHSRYSVEVIGGVLDGNGIESRVIADRVQTITGMNWSIGSQVLTATGTQCAAALLGNEKSLAETAEYFIEEIDVGSIHSELMGNIPKVMIPPATSERLMSCPGFVVIPIRNTREVAGGIGRIIWMRVDGHEWGWQVLDTGRADIPVELALSRQRSISIEACVDGEESAASVSIQLLFPQGAPSRRVVATSCCIRIVDPPCGSFEISVQDVNQQSGLDENEVRRYQCVISLNTRICIDDVRAVRR